MSASVRALARDVSVRVNGHELLMSAFAGDKGTEIVCVHLGDLEAAGPVPVRLHSGCLMGEVFDSGRCDCAWQLRQAIDLIATQGRGAVVYVPLQDGRGAGIGALLGSYELMDRGMSSAQAFQALGHPLDQRDYGPAVEVLCQLGVSEAIAITNNPEKVRALESAGIAVRERLPSVMADGSPLIREYLRGKAMDFGHLIEEVREQ